MRGILINTVINVTTIVAALLPISKEGRYIVVKENARIKKGATQGNSRKGYSIMLVNSSLCRIRCPRVRFKLKNTDDFNPL